MGPQKKSSRTVSGRNYMSDTVKAAAHPTRQAILRCLNKKPHTVIELEEATGENRYHLYHHLKKLEDTNLVKFRLVGKDKEYSLKVPKRPQAVYLELDRDDQEERDQLETLLKVVKEITKDQIPNLEKVVRASLVLSYPWSPEEKD